MTAAITMAASANASVSERLVAFTRDWRARGVPPAVRHEAKRLLLNQLKASVAATTHPAIGILHDWARHSAAGASGAQVLWLATNTGAAQAAMVNGALFEVLDFHDTYIPCFMHAVSAVLPAVLAEAEVSANSGAEFVSALALGLEIELAVADGVFAPHSKLRAAVTPAHRGVGGKGDHVDPDKPLTRRHVAMTWAQRLKRVFGVEIDTCARCGGQLKVIASIEEPQVIARILAHLEKSAPDQHQAELPLGARARPQQAQLI